MLPIRGQSRRGPGGGAMRGWRQLYFFIIFLDPALLRF